MVAVCGADVRARSDRWDDLGADVVRCVLCVGAIENDLPEVEVAANPFYDRRR